jgi:hypothetical protein
MTKRKKYNMHCSLVTGECFTMDTRPIVYRSSKKYATRASSERIALRIHYEDGEGTKETYEHFWIDYCPSCMEFWEKEHQQKKKR